MTIETACNTRYKIFRLLRRIGFGTFEIDRPYSVVCKWKRLRRGKKSTVELDVCLSVHRCIYAEKKNQLDATEWFIALIICSTCFGHFYAHHLELETIRLLLPTMVCNALFAGGRRSGAGQQAMRPEWGMLLEQHSSFRKHSLLPCTWPPTTSNQGIAHHGR